MGVAIGEAGCNPCAHSLIADFYPSNKRASALGVYQLGISIGVILGLLLGGWISQFFGWRMAFLAVGLPGILFAGLLLFTLKEPVRGLSDNINSKRIQLDSPGFGSTLRYLWELKSFVHITLGTSLIGIAIYTFFMWSPSFLVRSYGMSSGEIGTVLALCNGVFGGVGIYCGGLFADRLGAKNLRWYLLLPSFCALLAFPFALGIYLSSSVMVSIAFIGPPIMLGLVNSGPCYSLAQRLAQLRMRAMAASILLFMQNLIGLGVGPQITGFFSDFLAPQYGDESLRYALMISSLAYPWAALHFWLGARHLSDDLAKTEGQF
jgi:predicted MFS family arabinose efflux permease